MLLDMNSIVSLSRNDNGVSFFEKTIDFGRTNRLFDEIFFIRRDRAGSLQS